MASVLQRKLLSDLALPSGILVVASAFSYVVLYAVFGYTLELVFFSSLALVTMGLLLLFWTELPVSGVAKIVSFVIFLALLEESLLNSTWASYGVMLAFVGLLLLPVVGVVLAGKGRGVRVVFEVCGLLFATRIVFAPFPMHLLESAAFLPIIYTVIMSGVVVYLGVRRIPLEKVGLGRGMVPVSDQVLLGLLLGVVLGLVEHGILRPQPVDIGPNLLHNFLFLVVIMTVFVGLTEELLFRGLLQGYMMDALPGWQAVHLSSLIFALFHIGWLNPLEVVFAYAAGVIFGYLRVETGGLAAPILAHGFGNVVLYLLTWGLQF